MFNKMHRSLVFSSMNVDHCLCLCHQKKYRTHKFLLYPSLILIYQFILYWLVLFATIFKNVWLPQIAKILFYVFFQMLYGSTLHIQPVIHFSRTNCCIRSEVDGEIHFVFHADVQLTQHHMLEKLTFYTKVEINCPCIYWLIYGLSTLFY